MVREMYGSAEAAFTPEAGATFTVLPAKGTIALDAFVLGQNNAKKRRKVAVDLNAIGIFYGVRTEYALTARRVM